MAAVGSSSTSRSGSLTSATANRTRCFWPPESLLQRRDARSEIPLRRNASATGIGFAVQRGDHGDRLADGGVVEQGAALQHRADRCRSAHRVARARAEDGDRAGVGPGEAEQHVDGGRLARAVRAEQRHHLARRDHQVDPVDGADLAVVLAQAGQHDGRPRGRRAAGLGDLCRVHGVPRCARARAAVRRPSRHHLAMTNVRGRSAADQLAGEVAPRACRRRRAPGSCCRARGR